MIAFGITLFALFLLSLLSFNSEQTFSKDKMPVLRAFMAFVIILGHLSVRVPFAWIQPFRFWGAPFVSMFLFISGYGMWQSYSAHSELSLYSTLKRIWKLLLPYLITVGLYFLIVRIPCGETNLNIIQSIHSGTNSQSHLWYVFAIVFLYLIFYVCTRLHRKEAIIGSLFLIVGVTIILLRMAGYDRCWWISLFAFPTGCLYSIYQDKVNGVIFKNRIRYCIAMGIAIAGFGISYLTKVELLYSISHIFIPIAIALIVIQLPIETLNNKLSLHLGSISYEIYLCQLIAMDALSHFIPSMPALPFILCTLVGTLLLAELVSLLSRVISPRQ